MNQFDGWKSMVVIYRDKVKRERERETTVRRK